MNTATQTIRAERSIEKIVPLSLKLAPASRQRLWSLAEVQNRPAHAIAREAVEQYIEAQEEKIRRNNEANASWEHYQDTGLHVTGDEAIAWIRTWGTSNQLSKPICHV